MLASRNESIPFEGSTRVNCILGFIELAILRISFSVIELGHVKKISFHSGAPHKDSVGKETKQIHQIEGGAATTT